MGRRDLRAEEFVGPIANLAPVQGDEGDRVADTVKDEAVSEQGIDDLLHRGDAAAHARVPDGACDHRDERGETKPSTLRFSTRERGMPGKSLCESGSKRFAAGQLHVKCPVDLMMAHLGTVLQFS